MLERMLDIAGEPVHLVDHGGDGPPMLMVHGLAGSNVDWLDVAPAMARHHHVHALDLLGFGKTPLGRRRADLSADVRLVHSVVEALGDQPVLLVGNSAGGLISIAEAARAPNRIAGLVLVDPVLPGPRRRTPLVLAAAFLTLATPGIGGWYLRRHAAARGAERLVDDTLRLCTVDASRIAPSTRAAHVQLTRWREESGEQHRAFLDMSSSLVRWLWATDALEGLIRRVRAPTLLLHGDRDRLVSLRAAQSAAALRPDWRFHVFDDTGHIPQMERPGEFVEVVDAWLGDVRLLAADPGEAVADTVAVGAPS